MRRLEPVCGAVKVRTRERVTLLTFVFCLALTCALALTGALTLTCLGAMGTTLLPRSRHSTAQIPVMSTATMAMSAMVALFSVKSVHLNDETWNSEHVTVSNIDFGCCEFDQLCIVTPCTTLCECVT